MNLKAQITTEIRIIRKLIIHYSFTNYPLDLHHFYNDTS